MIKEKSIFIFTFVLTLFSACCKHVGSDVPPLVVSTDHKRVDEVRMLGLTDSLVYSLRLVRMESEDFGTLLERITLTSPNIYDSILIPVPSGVQDNRWLWKETLDVRFPEPGLIILTVPLGDTSEMVHYGKIDGILSESFTFLDHQNKLRELGQLFYIIDIHSRTPRTLAKIEGRAFDFSYPYLLIHTNFSYLRDSAVYSSDPGCYIPGGVEFSKSECVIIDLASMKIAARVSTPLSETCGLSRWVDKNLALTLSGKLLYGSADTFSPRPNGPSVYLIDQNKYMDMYDYYTMLGIVASREYKWVDRLKITEPNLLTDILFRRLDNIRGLGVGYSPESITTTDLLTGASTVEDMILPGGIVGTSVDCFSASPDTVLFLLTPQKSLSFYYLMGHLSRRFVHVPFITDLIGPPQELVGFRLLKRYSPRMRWELSREKNWLKVYMLDTKNRTEEILLVPVDALIDSTILKQHKSFQRIPIKKDQERSILFVPGENWVVHNNNGIPELYNCRAKSPAFPLMIPGEYDCLEIFFSPDGRYVGYECRIEGEDGYRLQVRRLPD